MIIHRISHRSDNFVTQVAGLVAVVEELATEAVGHGPLDDRFAGNNGAFQTCFVIPMVKFEW